MNGFTTIIAEVLESIGLDALRISFRAFLICLFGLAITQILQNTSAKFRYHLLMSVVVALLMAQVAVHTKTSFFEFPLIVESRVVVAEQVGVRFGSDGMTTNWQASSERSDLTKSSFIVTGMVWSSGLLCLVFATWRRLWRGLRIRPGTLDVIATRQVRRRLMRLLSPEYRELVHRIVVLKSQSVPSLIGWRGRLVGIPVSATTWDDELLPIVAVHELEHLRNGDHFKSLLIASLLCVQWMNPLSWLLSRLAYQEREIACDERAVSGLRIAPIEYFERLVQIAKKTNRMAVVPSIGGQNTLQARAARLIQPKPNDWCCEKLRVVFTLPLVAAVMLIPFTTTIAPDQTHDVEVTVSADAQNSILPESKTHRTPISNIKATQKLTGTANRPAHAFISLRDEDGK